MSRRSFAPPRGSMTFVLLFLAVTLVDGLEDASWEGATDG